MISKPANNNIDKLAGLTLPVNYNTEQGLALLLSNIIVSSCGVTPYFRMIPTAQYVSGNYTFPLPTGYLKVPYRLPMLEPKTWSALGDTIDALNPVALYQIGTDVDPMTRDFPVIINTTDYTVDGVVVKPLELNQSVVIRTYKNSGINVLWSSSNIVNNGLTDAAIRETMELTFVVTNVSGVYTVTEWITPSFVHNNLSSLQTTAKNTLAAAINEIYNKCNTAGGDLQGAYPNPTIKDGAVTNSKIADWSITTTKIGVGEVQSPNIGQGNSGIRTENIRDRSITAAKLASGSVTEPAVAPGSIWQGAYKDLSIPTTALSDGCVATTKIQDRTVTYEKMAGASVDYDNIKTGACRGRTIGAGGIENRHLQNLIVTNDKIAPNAVSNDKLRSDIGIKEYDYVVYDDASLVALSGNITATNVLIKKGFYSSNVAIRIHGNVLLIEGEAGNFISFGSETEKLDGFVCNTKSLSLGNNLVVRGIRAVADRYAFNGFPFVENCDGRVYTDSSSGPAPFYDCDKVINCICRADNNGGKIFSMKNCFNVRGCRRVVTSPKIPAAYETSYSGSIASSTYSCADTMNGGWNK